LAPSMTQRRPGWLSAQSALDQRAQEGRAHPLILGRRLDEAEEHLLPRERDLQGDDHGVVGERFPVQEEGHEVITVQPALTQRLELTRTRPDEPARDGRGAEPEGRRDGLRALRAGPAAQAPEDFEQHPPISLSRLMEALIRPEGNLPVRGEIPHPGVRDGELLIREVDRPALAAPADEPGAATAAPVPLARERRHLRLQRLANCFEAHGDKGLDERHGAVDPLCCWHGAQATEAHVFHLALSLHSEYPFHGSAPYCVRLWGVRAEPTSPHGSRFVNFQRRMTHFRVKFALIKTARALPIKSDPCSEKWS
jgi:hypothetical protein